MSTNVSVPAKVVAEDRRLEKAADGSARELMKLRWRWILDESNAQRVSAAAYARAVGVAVTRIKDDAHGYELLRRGTASTPNEARERAHMGDEKEAVTEVIASARNLDFGTVRRTRPDEIRDVRARARERAEERGTTVAQEARHIVERDVKAERAYTRERDDRRQRIGIRYAELDGKLLAAKRDLVEALDVARDVSWGDEERELLAHTIETVKHLLHLIDLAVVGERKVNWSQELKVIGGSR